MPKEVVMGSPLICCHSIDSLPLEVQEDCELAKIHPEGYVRFDEFCSWDDNPEDLLILREEHSTEGEDELCYENHEADFHAVAITVNGVPVDEHLSRKKECMVGRFTLEEYIAIFDAMHAGDDSPDDLVWSSSMQSSPYQCGMRSQVIRDSSARIYGPRSLAKNSKPLDKKHARGICEKFADC